MKPIARLSVLATFLACAVYGADGVNSDEVAEVVVLAKRVANDEPASGYATAATALRFDPLTELQSRGLAEGQSDVTVRGGLFENTGFKLGAVNVIDPQTGHYVAELPIDPAALTEPFIAKGIDSALGGFNASIATVNYDFRKLRSGGHVALGVGSDSLNHQRIRYVATTSNPSGNDIGVGISVARSEGDGTVEFGDHEFSRYNLQFQHSSDASQTDVVLSYQDKFYGWPGAYTGFATLPEIDDTQTLLFLANHLVTTNSGWIEVGAYLRELEDDYDFNRTTLETGVPGSFEHESRVAAIGAQGLHEGQQVSWDYGAQITRDKLVRSTDLTNGDFSDRTYATASLVPSFTNTLDSGKVMTFRAGATLDYSNQDGSEISPLIGIALTYQSAEAEYRYAFEYAQTTQLPGYTVLKSNTTGLFGGNPDLGRETARQFEASITRHSPGLLLSATVFVRKDDNLVDWTFATGSPFARQANAVDIDVAGFEAFAIREWDKLELVLGVTLLNKDANYGSAAVDASFYALNFARQRATVALTYRFAEQFELRLDTEYRSQEENPLRVGDDSTFLGAASLEWRPAAIDGLAAALVVDNITDSEYQPFPGTPASGQQVSITVSYDW